MVEYAGEHVLRITTDALMPREVLEGWSRGGAAWVRSLAPTERRALLGALADPQVGEVLAKDPAFFAALTALGLRGRLLGRAAAMLAARRYPPDEALSRALDATADLPPGWAAMARPTAFARTVAERVVAEGWPVVRDELQPPGPFPSATWAEAVVRQAEPRSARDYLRLIEFVDAGGEEPAGLLECQRELVRGLVGRVPGADERLRVARFLRARVGDVFGPNAAGWEGLADQRRVVRRWVADEALDVLFRLVIPPHVRPGQGGARLEFWRRYTPRVERLWLFIDDRLRARVERDDVRQVLDHLGDIVEVDDLHGPLEQGVAWMHLRGDDGRLCTVIEGNANASCRMSRAELFPPARRTVDFSRDVVHERELTQFAHNGPAETWQGKFRSALLEMGMPPCPGPSGRAVIDPTTARTHERAGPPARPLLV